MSINTLRQRKNLAASKSTECRWERLLALSIGYLSCQAVSPPLWTPVIKEAAKTEPLFGTSPKRLVFLLSNAVSDPVEVQLQDQLNRMSYF
jgi:hypothetical protein